MIQRKNIKNIIDKIFFKDIVRTINSSTSPKAYKEVARMHRLVSVNVAARSIEIIEDKIIFML